MIRDVPQSFEDIDSRLLSVLGITLKDLAFQSVGASPHDLALEELVAASVPVSSGKGVTAGFSESVRSIAEHLGMSAFVTERTDVAGLNEAISVRADLIFMADDEEFVAFNRLAGAAVNNTRSTARGYVTALKRAAGGLAGKNVLLVGAGQVGSYAAELLTQEGASVAVYDIDRGRAEALRCRFKGLQVCADLKGAMLEHLTVLNASPAVIPGGWVREGAVIASPGVPFAFDEEGVGKARAIIHDPLQLGVSVMAVWSASLSMARIPVALGGAASSEAF